MLQLANASNSNAWNSRQGSECGAVAHIKDLQLLQVVDAAWKCCERLTALQIQMADDATRLPRLPGSASRALQDISQSCCNSARLPTEGCPQKVSHSARRLPTVLAHRRLPTVLGSASRLSRPGTSRLSNWLRPPVLSGSCLSALHELRLSVCNWRRSPMLSGSAARATHPLRLRDTSWARALMLSGSPLQARQQVWTTCMHRVVMCTAAAYPCQPEVQARQHNRTVRLASVCTGGAVTCRWAPSEW